MITFVLALPHAIILYRAATDLLSKNNVSRIPLVIFLFFLVSIVSYAQYSNGPRTAKRFIPLIILSFVIWISVSIFEPNSNKYIHIPEYMFLSGLLFLALAVDYEGSGIFFLVFILTSLLGVVDEMQQGLYPDRYYGWKDMVINSAGALLGVIMIKTLTIQPTRDWMWVRDIVCQKLLSVVLFSGLGGTLFTGIMLWAIKVDADILGGQENGILAWNILYGSAATLAIIYLLKRFVFLQRSIISEPLSNTSLLWFISLFCLTIIIHGVSTLTLVTDLNFS